MPATDKLLPSKIQQKYDAALFDAIHEQDVVKLATAIRDGANVNARDGVAVQLPHGAHKGELRTTDYHESTSAVHLAASLGAVDCLRELIKNGANVNTQNQMRRTPLHIAAFKGNQEAVDLLLAAGASLTASSRALPGGKYKSHTPEDDAIQGGHSKIADSFKKILEDPYKRPTLESVGVDSNVRIMNIRNIIRDAKTEREQPDTTVHDTRRSEQKIAPEPSNTGHARGGNASKPVSRTANIPNE